MVSDPKLKTKDEGNDMQPQSNPFGASRQDHQDFVGRFRQGPRAVSDEEAASRYEQVVPNLPADVYQQSAQEVFAQLTPEQRMQLGQALIQSARQQGQSFLDVNQDGIDDRLQDPDYLAQTATQVEQKQPGLLRQLLGGGKTVSPAVRYPRVARPQALARAACWAARWPRASSAASQRQA
jgi:hypothetical protein